MSSNVPHTSERPVRVALISASILMLELAFIRLIPAEVKAISYFSNLLLFAAFLGMGVGCILQQQRSLAWLVPVGLLLVYLFIYVGRGIVIYEEAKQVHYWLQESAVRGRAYSLPLFWAATSIFLFAALPFVALGQALARSMDHFAKLTAYGWDIAGSLVGTILFVLASFLGVPPWIWPFVLAMIWAALLLRSHLARLVWIAVGALFLTMYSSPYPSRWSPYYYLQYDPSPSGIRVWVNSSFHQFGIDFTSQARDDKALHEIMKLKWGLPYQLYRERHSGKNPEKVLILGAGTGNDINIALFEGAKEVTAVEIDPEILYLGQHFNSSRPYDDPRVRTYVDDGRHFVRTATDRYDLVVFGTLDSQALLNNQANLRLESYVYTRESLLDVRHRLADDGMVAVYYSIFKPWLVNRLYVTIREAFGDQTRIYFHEDRFLFDTVIVAAKNDPGFTDTPQNVAAFASGIPTTDDWPFVFLEYPNIAPVYLKLFVVILVLVVCSFFLLRRTHAATGLHLDFLLLGMGFTLMESSAIVRLSFLFGNTWIVNAVVIGAFLATIFLANLAVAKKKALPLNLAWPSLCVLVLVNYLFPIHVLFEVDAWARVLLSSLLIGAPVYSAAVCFSHLFEKETVTGYPLGINLVGAMAGGVLEYSSMLYGLRMVWLLVLFIYAAAWVATVVARTSRPKEAGG